MSAMPSPVPHVVSVNVGLPRTVQTATRPVTTGIWKAPVAGRIRARGVNLEGDAQADKRNHGGPDKAVYAYALEDMEYWEHHLGRPLGPGSMGENLSTVGLDLNEALIGERWAIGSATFEVSEPRSPCYRLALRHGDPTLVRAFVAAQRPGTYLRIRQEGDIGAGDRIEVLFRPDHEVTVRLAFQAWQVDRRLIPRLRAAPQLPPAWKDWIDKDPQRGVRFA
jgi:MOSC domain-containing protein YiiM